MIVAIVGCEIAFWVVLGAGLVARYLLRRPRLGAGLLLCVPLVDVVLLVVTVLDLRNGASPSPSHGLAALYIGFSVAWGHALVRWADVRAAHRWAGGPAPAPKPRGGTAARVALEWREWGKALLAAAVSVALLFAMDVAIGDAGHPTLTTSWAPRLAPVLLIWLIVAPVWETARAVTRPSR